MLATGLGAARVVARQPVIQMVKTGTDNIAMEVNYDDLAMAGRDSPQHPQHGAGNERKRDWYL